MSERAATLRRRFADERGISLPELLVSILLGSIVLVAVVGLLITTVRAQPGALDQSEQVQEARVKMERMVREIRQGAAVSGSPGSASSLTVDTYTRGGCNGAAPTPSAIVCRVTYACSQASASVPASCTRKAGTAAAQPVLTGLLSPNIFSYGSTTAPTCSSASAGTPSYVCLKMTFRADDGSETVTVEDNVYLRNG